MTPCTRVIVMDKWVKDYIRIWDNSKLNKFECLLIEKLANDQSSNQLKLNFTVGSTLIKIQENLNCIKSLLNKYRVKIVTAFEDIEKMIMKLIFSLLNRDQRIFSSEFVSRLLLNDNFLKSVIVVGVEITLFIENVELICFYKLVKAMDLDYFEFWKVLNPFIRVDLTIPSDIRLHFEEMEIGLWSFIIWKTASTNFKLSVESFLKELKTAIISEELKDLQNIEFNNQSLFLYFDNSEFLNERQELQNSYIVYSQLSPIYILLRRVLNYSIFLNKKVTDKLKVSTEIAKESEIILKKIITNSHYIDVLYDKHIDQVIVCNLIGVLKFHKLFEQKNLQQILEAYQMSRSDISENHPLSRIDRSGTTLMELYAQISRKIETLTNEICCEDEEEELRKFRRRKFSLPENMNFPRSQFEQDTAFTSETEMYEPLSLTVFANEKKNSLQATGHLLLRNSNFVAYSTNSSPCVSRSVNNAGRTPRTKGLRDAYGDFISESAGIYYYSSEQKDYTEKNRSFKKKILSTLNSNKLNFANLGQGGNFFEGKIKINFIGSDVKTRTRLDSLFSDHSPVIDLNKKTFSFTSDSNMSKDLLDDFKNESDNIKCREVFTSFSEGQYAKKNYNSLDSDSNSIKIRTNNEEDISEIDKLFSLSRKQTGSTPEFKK
jgi:hypothetical protein